MCGISLFLVGCHHPATPREYGYFRIALPEKEYTSFADDAYPYSFEYAAAAEVRKIDYQEEKYWIDIFYPRFNATIHCSYKPVKNNLRQLSRDAQEFVYSHAVKATAIPEHEYANPDEQVYGILYDLEGNTATPLQFYLTDSIENFFRGSCYFNCVPNQDSLSPVIAFLREDITHLVESFQWH